jgi:hypothetical protein
MLAYTGNDGSIMSNAPPRMGAIIPPLFTSINFFLHGGHEEGRTYTRETAEAVPQAVPRTDKGSQVGSIG